MIDQGEQQSAVIEPTISGEKFAYHEGEKIPEGEINTVVDSFTRFYELPPEISERGRRTKGFFVNEEQMISFMEEYLKYKTDTLFNKYTQDPSISPLHIALLQRMQSSQNRLVAENHVKMKGGMFMIKPNGDRVFAIKRSLPGDRRSLIAHELSHSMACPEPEDGGGFMPAEREGVQDFPDLDEGATELVVIAEANQDLSLPEIAAGLKNGKVSSSYPQETAKLASLLALTHSAGGRPMIPKDLGYYYFGDKTPGDNKQEFMLALIECLPPDEHGTAERYFASLVNSRQLVNQSNS